MRSTRESSLIN
jgi:hypothetical protein